MNNNRTPSGREPEARGIKTLLFIAWAPFKLKLFRLRLIGWETIPTEGPIIVACNHLSMLDAVVLWMALKAQAVAIAMAELWDKRKLMGLVLGPIMTYLGMVPVVRRDHTSGAQAQQAAIDHVNRGGRLFIFPHGECIEPGVYGKMHSGVARIALATGVTVYPVGISGSEKFGRYASLFWVGKKRTKIVARVGQPIRPDGYTVKGLLERIQQEVMALAQP